MPCVLPVIEVMKSIPDRYSICYTGYVDTLGPGKKIVATKNVTINEDFFQNHFLDSPVVSDALILETLAQAGSILILKSGEFLGKRAYIGGIDKAKFRQKAVLRDMLKCHFEIVKIRGPVGTALFTAYVDDKRVCECEFTFIVNRNA